MRDVILRAAIAVGIVAVLAVIWYAVLLPLMLIRWLACTALAVVLAA